MRERIAGIWESIYPYTFALAAAPWTKSLPINTPTTMNNWGLILPNLYGALFNLNIFGAGLMVSVYLFTMAPAAGFIAKLEGLRLYKVFRRYVQEAVMLGVFAGITCIPLYASTAQALEKANMPALSVVAVSLSVAFLSAIFRAGRIFLFWSSRN